MPASKPCPPKATKRRLTSVGNVSPGKVTKKRRSDKRRNQNPYDAIDYMLHTADDMGELRKNAFKALNLAAFNNNYEGFEPVGLHPFKPTAIRCRKDNSLIALHLPAPFLATRGISSKYIAKLAHLVQDLPYTKSTGAKNRGLYDSRSYQLWVASTKDPLAAPNSDKTGLLRLSKDYLDDGEKGRLLVKHCSLLWEVLGRIHRRIFPREGGVLERYILEERATGEFLAAPWPGMSINRGHPEFPVETIPHKDTKNAFFSLSPLFVFGEFSGGEVVLWEQQATVDMKSGAALFVPGHLVTHSNKKVIGNRSSLVAYAPKETMSHNQNKRDVHIDKSNRKREKAKLNHLNQKN
jgi:hypothetical protein